MRRATETEHSHQVAVIDWWSLAHKKYGLPDFALYAIPNANALYSQARNRFALMQKMRDEGVRSGILDLNLDAKSPRDPAAMGLRIEMKKKPNKPSPEQEEVLMYLRKTGYHALVCWDAEEAIRAISGYLAT